jgi:hypothetical protein
MLVKSNMLWHSFNGGTNIVYRARIINQFFQFYSKEDLKSWRINRKIKKIT